MSSALETAPVHQAEPLFLPQTGGPGEYRKPFLWGKRGNRLTFPDYLRNLGTPAPFTCPAAGPALLYPVKPASPASSLRGGAAGKRAGGKMILSFPPEG